MEFAFFLGKLTFFSSGRDDSMNAADTAFVLFSAALVMLMTPGLALFYGGLVRSKNVLGTIMQNFFMLGVIGVQWALIGYSLAFGPDIGGVVGSLKYIGLSGVGAEPFETYSKTIPHSAFMIFQAMFAIITPALITGAWAERLKFSSFLVFILLWATLVYDPVAHWVWGDGGWLKSMGAPWTSPAAPWCTSTPASRLWWRPSSSASGRATAERPLFPITCP